MMVAAAGGRSPSLRDRKRSPTLYRLLHILAELAELGGLLWVGRAAQNPAPVGKTNSETLC